MHFNIYFISSIILRIIYGLRNFFPDKIYLKIIFRLKMGYKLNLDNPKTFNEKLQWLKLYNRKIEYTTMVDKYSVKDFVSTKLGEDCIIPTLGVWNNANDIDFDSLPDKFVLKTTHGGGGCGIIICKDKKLFDKENAIYKLNESLKTSIYSNFREWPYKDVCRRIIAEPYIEDKNIGELRDYKFFCFNGEAKFCKVDYGRFIEHRANYYDLNWNILPFGEKCFPPDENVIIEKPINFDIMIEYVNKLSNNIPFVRIDLYNISGKIYFGEITFFPASGFGEFTSKGWDEKLGHMINLNI